MGMAVKFCDKSSALRTLLSISALVAAAVSAADPFDEEGFSANVVERFRRVPLLYPKFWHPRTYRGIEDEIKNDDEFSRKRRTPFYYPIRGASAGYSMQDDEENGHDDDLDGAFLRRRRIPYFFPRFYYGDQANRNHRPMSYDENQEDYMKKRWARDQGDDENGDEDLEEFAADEETKRSLRKRGMPYYFPNFSYSFLGWPYQGMKRFGSAIKRTMSKRSNGVVDFIEDMFNQDPTNFGYDKKKKRDLGLARKVSNGADPAGGTEEVDDRRRRG